MLRRFLRRMTEIDDVLDVAQMDDRMLADMGLERGEIGLAVRGGLGAPGALEGDAPRDSGIEIGRAVGARAGRTPTRLAGTPWPIREVA